MIPSHPSQSSNNGVAWRLRVFVLCFVCLCSLSSGCSRAFWRRQADKDSYAILDAKTLDPRWNLPRLDVEPDPRSRFFDPYNRDKPPLPLDDPSAHVYMHEVDGMKGYKNWYKFGTSMSIENPNWLAAFDISPESVDAEGRIVGPVPKIENMTLDQAIELGNINSREYQRAIEDLYLEALSLTFERFQFGVRYLGFSGEPTSDLTYTSVPDGENSLVMNNGFGVSRFLPTGGQWIVELANNTIWLFNGRDSMSTASVLSYSIVQPLLFGAGRKVVLENLTQQERNVLYAARDLVRFRQEFFTDTVGGTGRGFLGLLAQQQNVRNQRNNVRQLEEQLELIRTVILQRPEEIPQKLDQLPPGFQIPEDLRGLLRYDANQKLLYWRGLMTEAEELQLRGLSDDPTYRMAVDELVSIVQAVTKTLTVAQLETRLADSRNALRDSERAYQDLLDNFKIFLGLPPDMEMTIDDGLLRQFELIDPRLSLASDRIKRFVDVWAELDEENPDQAEVRNLIDLLDELRNLLQRDGFDIVDDDVQRLREKLDGAGSGTSPIVDRGRVIADVERDLRLLAVLKNDFSDATKELKRIRDEAGKENLTVEQLKTLRADMKDLQERSLLKVSQGLQVIEVGQRVELIGLQPFNMPLPEAVTMALENRVDLMNVRARVMDARRKMEVAANALEAVLNVRAEGDIRTPRDNNPVDFRGDQSAFRVGLEFTAPLDQITERNVYRASLIDYQRLRRDYMLFEDNVKLQVRQSWRQIDVLRNNFETAKQGVRSAALQLDYNVEDATRPITSEEALQTRQNDNAGLNILEALESVLSQQNSLIRIWVQYEQNRLNIHRDMGLMDIDDRGIWTDEVYQRRSQRAPSGPAGTVTDGNPFGPVLSGDAPAELDKWQPDAQPEPEILRTGAAGCRPVPAE